MHKKLFLPFFLLFAMLGGTVKAAPAMLRAHSIGVVVNDTIINNANAEVHAMYPGGEAALLKFINKNTFEFVKNFVFCHFLTSSLINIFSQSIN